ncbi:MAG: RusA family crossover junction endodeoxyribonuclease [Clostridia bacterium]|nr:RusA family crossover junction endodeoxyribonuclease [Clostridia bacterium]
MENSFVIPTKLPSLNDYVAKCRTHAFVGAKFKEETEETIGWYILSALQTKSLKRVKNYPVEISIEWHEGNRKRDCDNIQSSKKFILDAMKNLKVIKDDSRQYISQIHDEIVDDNDWQVIVKIIEKEE